MITRVEKKEVTHFLRFAAKEKIFLIFFLMICDLLGNLSFNQPMVKCGKATEELTLQLRMYRNSGRNRKRYF